MSARHLTVEQAAEELGVGHKMIRAATAAEELPARRIGRVLRIDREDFEEWLETLRPAAAGASPARPRRPQRPRPIRGDFARRARLPAGPDRG